MKLATYPEVEIDMNGNIYEIEAKLEGSIQLDLTYATVPISETASIKMMNEPPIIDHLETHNHLFDDAMCDTNVGKFMVLANYWEEVRPYPFYPRNI